MASIFDELAAKQKRQKQIAADYDFWLQFAGKDKQILPDDERRKMFEWLMKNGATVDTDGRIRSILLRSIPKAIAMDILKSVDRNILPDRLQSVLIKTGI